MGNEFSVLMLVYGGDRPAHFDAALRSIAAQTLPPAEIVLVVDGPVPEGAEKVIRKYGQDLHRGLRAPGPGRDGGSDPEI